MSKKEVKPYGKADKSKKEEVAEMFDNISNRYDFLNHLLSAGIDKKWRKKAIKMLKEHKPKIILDIATGTGDFAIESLRLSPREVIGVDISDGMLEKGRKKLKKKNLTEFITLHNGDSENLKFDDAYFDAITVGFGVRNFENLDKGLGEMHRVLKKGGVAAVLEFSKPKKFPVKQFNKVYQKNILPTIGRTVSKDKKAYTYLPESVDAFPEGKEFAKHLEGVGFNVLEIKPVTGGIATIYLAQK